MTGIRFDWARVCGMKTSPGQIKQIRTILQQITLVQLAQRLFPQSGSGWSSNV